MSGAEFVRGRDVPESSVTACFNTLAMSINDMRNVRSVSVNCRMIK